MGMERAGRIDSKAAPFPNQCVVTSKLGLNTPRRDFPHLGEFLYGRVILAEMGRHDNAPEVVQRTE
jgi:hypothetical protein